ncbi:hypothetical protein HMPREF1870_00611 [Bacteroidales bacterium KA00344]|nr:hypothetical protein HMPREF1870_00611 [Bacteroidales bacterium KA00344]
MAGHKSPKPCCFRVAKVGRDGKNMALFALIASKIITEKQ